MAAVVPSYRRCRHEPDERRRQVIETYRMLGREHEFDLEREARGRALARASSRRRSGRAPARLDRATPPRGAVAPASAGDPGTKRCRSMKRLLLELIGPDPYTLTGTLSLKPGGDD
jgi:hypothetical protein